MKRAIVLLLIFLSMTVDYQVSLAQTSANVQQVKYPEGYTAQFDIVYTEVNGWQGKLDLYLPPKVNGKKPLLINIHGGGWNKGTKESQNGFAMFFEKGYAVANIEYRLVQVAPAPAAIEDARCALNYLINNAGVYNIDLKKVVMLGTSAGAHLALMAGLLENDARFDTNCKASRKVKVAAIIDEYGIADVWDWAYGPYITNDAATWWLGTKAKNEAFIKSVSPINYVKRNSPPVFIVHGDADPIVPYQESVALKHKLDSCGVKNEFITVKGGKHGSFTAENYKELKKGIMQFLLTLGIHHE
jgi:acetyl esterase/lipase